MEIGEIGSRKATDVVWPAFTDHSGPLGRMRHIGAAVEAVLLGAIVLFAFIGLGIINNPWYRVVAIHGGSMEPTFSSGDLIVVRPAPSTIEPGMVLVMTVGDEVVTHRVVAVNGDGTFMTRGDANDVNDPWDGQQVQVDGLYVATIPWLGRVLPIPDASGALFADAVSASMHITVGPFPIPVPPPTPPECAGMTFAQVIVGTAGDDVIQAGNGGAIVFGLGGSDTITGGNGKDCLVGGEGDDTLAGGNGKDVLLGGDGNDTLRGAGDGDLLDGGNGKDLLDGGSGTDTCYGTSKDTFVQCEAPSTDSAASPRTSAPTASPTADPAASTILPTPSPTPGTTPGVIGPESPPSTPSPTVTPAEQATPPATPSPSAPPDPSLTPSPEPTSTSVPTPTETVAPGG